MIFPEFRTVDREQDYLLLKRQGNPLIGEVGCKKGLGKWKGTRTREVFHQRINMSGWNMDTSSGVNIR